MHANEVEEQPIPVALLSPRGIEPRAPSLQHNQVPDIGHFWWTPPTLLWRIRGQEYKTQVTRINRTRETQDVTTVSGDSGRKGGPASPMPWLCCWSNLWIQERNSAFQSKLCVPRQFRWDLFASSSWEIVLNLWLNVVMDDTVSCCN